MKTSRHTFHILIFIHSHFCPSSCYNNYDTSYTESHRKDRYMQYKKFHLKTRSNPDFWAMEPYSTSPHIGIHNSRQQRLSHPQVSLDRAHHGWCKGNTTRRGSVFPHGLPIQKPFWINTQQSWKLQRKGVRITITSTPDGITVFLRISFGCDGCVWEPRAVCRWCTCWQQHLCRSSIRDYPGPDHCPGSLLWEDAGHTGTAPLHLLRCGDG